MPPVHTALVSFRNPKVNRSAVPSAIKENPSLEVFKVSYLWVEAYLTDIAGDDWPLCLHHRRPKGVRHHSLLDGVHLRTDNPEVTSKIQQHRRSSERLSSYCGWERNVKGKVQVNDRGCRWGGRKLGDEKRVEWIVEGAEIDVDRRVCVISVEAAAAELFGMPNDRLPISKNAFFVCATSRCFSKHPARILHKTREIFSVKYLWKCILDK